MALATRPSLSPADALHAMPPKFSAAALRVLNTKRCTDPASATTSSRRSVMTPASLTLRDRVVILLGLTVLSLLAALAERLDQRERRRRTTPTAVRAEASRETTTTRRLAFRIKP